MNHVSYGLYGVKYIGLVSLVVVAQESMDRALCHVPDFILHYASVCIRLIILAQ